MMGVCPTTTTKAESEGQPPEPIVSPLGNVGVDHDDHGRLEHSGGPSSRT